MTLNDATGASEAEGISSSKQRGGDADAAWILVSGHGPTAGFEDFVNRYRRPIIAFVGARLKDPGAAEDVAQRVFIQVFLASHRFRFESKVSTWLYTIAKNLCLNEIRNRARGRVIRFSDFAEFCQSSELAPLDHRDASVKDGYETLCLKDLREEIQRALKKLPKIQQCVITQFLLEGKCYDEIAMSMGLSCAATKSMIHRARKTLRKNLEAIYAR